MEHKTILKRKQSKQIRIKKVCKHANPLFEKWLLEWAEEASKHNSNMKFNFQKAIASLRRYPLPLYSGKECLLLSHFGDKICKLLDKKLEEYVSENGPINWNNIIKVVDANCRKKVSKKKSPKTGCLEGKLFLHIKDSPELQSSGSKVKQYIPAYRSGSYALILALFRDTETDNSLGYLKKNNLIDTAQQFCDVSFVIPPSGSHYTAWSSMSTLINKNLVIREGNPSRYYLTEAGKKLGQILENHKKAPVAQTNNSLVNSNIESLEHDNEKQVRAYESFGKSKLHCSREVHNISGSESEDESLSCNYGSISSEPSSYANASTSTNSIPDTEVILLSDDDDDEDKDECFLENVASENFSEISNENVSSKKELPLHSVANTFLLSQSRINNTSNDSDEKCSIPDKKELKFTYIDCAERETLFKDNASVKIDPTAGSLMFLIKCKLCDLLNTSLDFEFDDTRIASPGYTYVYLLDSCAPDYCSLDKKLEDLPDINVNISGFKKAEEIAKNLKDNNFHISKKPRRLSPPEVLPYAAACSSGILQCSNYKEVISTNTEGKNIKENNKKTKPLFSFLPDQFKIVLCVDNMEVTGGYSCGKKGSKDIIINELKNNGVDFDVRKLSIGDFLWICQEKFPSGNICREIVLPFIVERKRMDDLASSIRDGRFREQKFRLKKSGLKNPIYLVEEIGSNHLSIPLSTCEQAFTNTQFIDGFTVKVTTDQRESAAYLTVMTKYLQHKFKDKMIDCLEMKDFLNEETIAKNIIGPSFEELNNFSIKNQILSIQDIFAKHLLQLSGNSVDKVTAIITKYSTPALLRDALKNLPSNQKEEFLSSLKCLKSGKPVGSTISSLLARLYTWTELA